MWGLSSIMYLHLGSMNEASHLPCSCPPPRSSWGLIRHNHFGQQATQDFSVCGLSWPCPTSNELGPNQSIRQMSLKRSPTGLPSTLATHSICLPTSPRNTQDDQGIQWLAILSHQSISNPRNVKVQVGLNKVTLVSADRFLLNTKAFCSCCGGLTSYATRIVAGA